jgi:hypothetical protein
LSEYFKTDTINLDPDQSEPRIIESREYLKIATKLFVAKSASAKPYVSILYFAAQLNLTFCSRHLLCKSTAMADTVAEPEEAPVLNSPDNDAPAADTTVVKKTKKIIRRKKRPARTQVDPSFVKSEPPPQTGTIFNIWYAKWSGGDRGDQQDLNTPAPGRCNIARDSGYTRADKVTGSFFCRKWLFSPPLIYKPSD